MTKAYNPLFMDLSDKVALSVMRSLKTSKRLVATGKTDEERQKILMPPSVVSKTAARVRSLKLPTKTAKEIYTDNEGNPIDSSGRQRRAASRPR